MPPGLAAAPNAGVALAPVAGNTEETWLNAGAAEAQPCGTDNTPSEAARPTPAVTAAFPMPTEPNMPVPEPTPLPSAGPKS
jgi:hypothetical protein